MKNQWRVIIGFILVLLIVVFAVLNSQSVPVNFGIWEINGPLILIILGSAILGAVIVLLTSTTALWQQRKRVKELEGKQAEFEEMAQKKTEQELANLQTQYEETIAQLKNDAHADSIAND